MRHGRVFGQFVVGSLRIITRGGVGYWLWLLLLVGLIIVGIAAYHQQLTQGLILTNMRDEVSWGFYIGNFTFFVGVAAAAIVLVIPAYVYQWGPIKEIVVLGELLAVSACVMCALFVMVDIGRPERLWHMIPTLGYLNLPSSILAWDVVVLNAYLLLNLVIVTYILFSGFRGRPYHPSIVWTLVILSVPMAVSIHTVTAFVYSGFPARPFWNTAILAPRFLVSAFCSGPAILLIILQVLRRTTPLAIKDDAIWKIAELMAYAMFINLFLQAVELFAQFYSNTEHTLFARYLFFGLHGHRAVVPYSWLSMACGTVAFLLFLVPATRRWWLTLNIGCVLIFVAVYLEKGMCLVIPGLTPDTLGEIYEYAPSPVEWMVSAGIFGVGFLLLTLMTKVAIEISLGRLTVTASSATRTAT